MRPDLSSPARAALDGWAAKSLCGRTPSGRLGHDIRL